MLVLIFFTISCTFEDDNYDSYENLYIKHVLPQIKFGSVLKHTGNCKENEEGQKNFLYWKNDHKNISNACWIILLPQKVRFMDGQARSNALEIPRFKTNQIFYKPMGWIDTRRTLVWSREVYAFGSRSHLWAHCICPKYSQKLPPILGPGSHIAYRVNFDTFNVSDTPETISFYFFGDSKVLYFG